MFRANVVDMSPTTLVLEAVSSPAKLDSLLTMLEGYGTCELVRTGRIALARGAAVITDDAAGEPGAARAGGAGGAGGIAAAPAA